MPSRSVNAHCVNFLTKEDASITGRIFSPASHRRGFSIFPEVSLDKP
jgi:hypothetical protein